MRFSVVCLISLPFVALALVLGAVAVEAGELKGRIVGAGENDPVVVWIEGISGGEVPRRDTVITHVPGGRLQPHVSIGFVGNSFVLRNDDDTMHNTHLYLRLAYQKESSGRPLEYGATVLNVALPKAGTEVKKPIEPYHRYRDDTGFIEVACNPHPNEKAYVLVFDHPYAAVTSQDGTFAIPDVPVGKHEVWIWHGGAVRKWQEVEIKDGVPTEVAIEVG